VIETLSIDAVQKGGFGNGKKSLAMLMELIATLKIAIPRFVATLNQMASLEFITIILSGFHSMSKLSFLKFIALLEIIATILSESHSTYPF